VAVTLTQLRAFVAVERTGSVHGAADELLVSQPSVSSALAGLARELGVELLERDGRGIRLTAAGRAFAPYAAEALGVLAQGRAAAEEATHPDSPRIRIAAVNTAGEFLLPPLIQAYRARETAELLLEIGNRRAVVDLIARRQADVGIGGRPDGKAVAGFPFLDNELVVVGRAPAPDVESATWLLREEGSGTRAAAEELLARRGIEPREALTLGSNGAVKQALALGLGVSLLSTHAVARELRDGDLVRIPVPGTPLRRPWYALHATGVEPRPAVRAFLAFLRSAAARQAIEQTL
jgi:LysR family transcriptional regulator, low CO2-responsive transcriptional regulator